MAQPWVNDIPQFESYTCSFRRFFDPHSDAPFCHDWWSLLFLWALMLNLARNEGDISSCSHPVNDHGMLIDCPCHFQPYKNNLADHPPHRKCVNILLRGKNSTCLTCILFMSCCTTLATMTFIPTRACPTSVRCFVEDWWAAYAYLTNNLSHCTGKWLLELTECIVQVVIQSFSTTFWHLLLDSILQHEKVHITTYMYIQL